MRPFHVSFVLSLGTLVSCPLGTFVRLFLSFSHLCFLSITEHWTVNIERNISEEIYSLHIWRDIFVTSLKRHTHFTAPSDRANVFSKLYLLFINFFISTLMLVKLYLLISVLCYIIYLFKVYVCQSYLFYVMFIFSNISIFVITTPPLCQR